MNSNIVIIVILYITVIYLSRNNHQNKQEKQENQRKNRNEPEYRCVVLDREFCDLIEEEIHETEEKRKDDQAGNQIEMTCLAHLV